jgi:hypothetical protein
MIRILRFLKLLDGIDRLMPEAGARPMDLLKLKGKGRQRASSKVKNKDHEIWQWGEQ